MTLHNPPNAWTRLFDAQRGCCFHCGNEMIDGLGPDDQLRVTREHVIPISKGGSRSMRNVVLAHHLCNGARGVRDFTPLELARARSIWLEVFGEIEMIHPCKLGPEALTRAEPILHSPPRGWRGGREKWPTLAFIWPREQEA